MPPVGFEPTISAGERPQTYALDRAATGTGVLPSYVRQCNFTGGKAGGNVIQVLQAQQFLNQNLSKDLKIWLTL